VSQSKIICSNNQQFSPDSVSTVVDPYIVGNEIATGVAFRNLRGQVYFGEFSSRQLLTLSTFLPSGSFSLFTSNDFKFSFDRSVVGQVLESTNNTTQLTLRGASIQFPSPPFGFLGKSSSSFSWGRNITNSWSCILSPNSCTFNDSTFTPLVAQSFTTLFPSEITYMNLDRTAGLYVTNGTVKFLGLPYCYTGSFSGSCSFISQPLVENIPMLNSVTNVSLGAWGACAVSSGSLSCWGSYPSAYPLNNDWSKYKSVSKVSINNSGGCVEYTHENTSWADCWGNLSLSIRSVSMQTSVLCDRPSDIIYENLCFPCSYGEILSSLSSTFLQCIPCSSTSIRGPNSNACISCGEGQTNSSDFSSCTLCPPNSFRSESMTRCEECRPGFQGSSNRLECVQCPQGTARVLGALSCSQCLPGTIPTLDQTLCAGCPQPQILSFTSSYTCQMCPLGQNAFQGSCINCLTPNFRSQSMMDCLSCPQGTEPSTDFTFCVPCPDGRVRKDTSRCYLCPSGTLPSLDKTSCLPILKTTPFFLSPLKTAYIGAGLLVLCATGILVSFNALNSSQSLVGYLLGIMIVSGSLLF
jgi:hypothetical protein